MMNRTGAFVRCCLIGGFVLPSLISSVSAQPPRPPGAPGAQPAPTCPIYPVGFVNGAWYYVTSNCMGTTGYGMSPTYYETSQCDGTTCRNPVMSSGAALAADEEVPQSEIDEFIKAVTEARDKMQRAVNGSKVGPDRKARINKVLPYANEVLTYLKGSTGTNAEKKNTYYDFARSLSQHQRQWSYMGMAPGSSFKMAVKDEPVDPKELKNVADTKFDTSKVDAAKVNVAATKDKLLKISRGRGVDPVFFQCFKVDITRKVAPAGRDTLMLAIETTPTEAEKATAEDGEFSEQGDFAHRIKDRNGRPFVAVGATQISP